MSKKYDPEYFEDPTNYINECNKDALDAYIHSLEKFQQKDPRKAVGSIWKAFEDLAKSSLALDGITNSGALMDHLPAYFRVVNMSATYFGRNLPEEAITRDALDWIIITKDCENPRTHNERRDYVADFMSLSEFYPTYKKYVSTNLINK